MNTDLIIIGSGGAGLTAAVQAADLGMHVTVLEKEDKVGGNTNRASSGMNAAETDVQLKHGVIDHTDDFYRETMQGGGRLNDPSMLRFFVNHASLAVSWLSNHGIKLTDLTITGGMSKMRTHRPASTAPIGAFLIKNLLELAEKAGVNIKTSMKVTRLLQDNAGKVTGVEVQDNNDQVSQLHASAVILASGGFGASHELIAKYRPDLANYRTTNQDGATGDGLRLGKDVGAQLMQLDLVQVHPTVQQDNPHAFLIGEAVRGEGAILVNAHGDRFVNELATRRVVSNAITALPEHSAYLIFDHQIRKRVKAIDFYDHIGLVHTGQSLESLMDELGLINLANTVSIWNEEVRQHKDNLYGRTTGMERTIEDGPFYAIHVAPAIHYTMGGLHADAHTRVLDANGNPIKGLYAAGEVVGGLHGNNRIGGNSIAETVVFGRQAALTAKEEM